jgi:hypothetical protein
MLRMPGITEFLDFLHLLLRKHKHFVNWVYLRLQVTEAPTQNANLNHWTTEVKSDTFIILYLNILLHQYNIYFLQFI